MTDYLDTSVLVSAVSDEPASVSVRDWFRNTKPGTLFISDWSLTEFASAMSLKVRTGTLSLDQRAQTLNAWQNWRDNSLVLLPVTTAHFETAAALAARHDLGLRAGDALHLAIAAASGHRMITLDKVMAEATPLIGLPVFVPTG